MRLKPLQRNLAWSLISLLFAACWFGCTPTTSNNNNTNTNTNNTTDGGDPPPARQVTQSASKHPTVKFKGGERIANDLSQALGLEQNKMCLELGKFDCFKDAHLIVLGGVEPYKAAIMSPWELAPIIAPIAVDRVALSVCEKRAKADFADAGKAIIFKDLATSNKADTEAMKNAVTTLYKRLLLRPPTADEQDALVKFWDKVQAKGGNKPLVTWATLTCFGIASSAEFLFY